MVKRAPASKPRSARSSPTTRLCDHAVVAVTGSIGALWTPHFVMMLRVEGRVKRVRVVMSDSATRLITPAAMRAVSGEPVLTGLFDAEAPFPVGHIDVTEDANVLIVMPATAGIIGKVAAGIADDAVSASILAAECPVVFVPNMNDRMWRRAAVQRNIRTLKRDGYHIVPPEKGLAVSTGRTTAAVMPSLETILAAIRRVLRSARR